MPLCPARPLRASSYCHACSISINQWKSAQRDANTARQLQYTAPLGSAQCIGHENGAKIHYTTRTIPINFERLPDFQFGSTAECQTVGLAIDRSRVQIPTATLSSATRGGLILLKHVPLRGGSKGGQGDRPQWNFWTPVAPRTFGFICWRIWC